MNNFGLKTFIYIALILAVVLTAAQVGASYFEKDMEEIPALRSYQIPLPTEYKTSVFDKVSELSRNLQVSYRQITERTDLDFSYLEGTGVSTEGTTDNNPSGL